MASAERLERDQAIDTLVSAALPPRGELEHMTFDAILALYTPGVVRVAGSLGLTLTTAEVEQLLERLVGVKEMPPFRREHYDVLC